MLALTSARVAAALAVALAACTQPPPRSPAATTTTTTTPGTAAPPSGERRGEDRPGAATPAEEAPAILRLASWNLRRLGHGEKRLDLAARLIAAEDVVVLQEVMTPDGVTSLLEHLPGWAAVVSPGPVGKSGYAEHYAVIYRSAALEVVDSYTVDDPDDRFTREPFVACLRSGQFDFCILTIHVVFGDRVGPRDAEIAALAPLVAGLSSRSKERDWLIIGDFNRPAKARSFAALEKGGFAMATADRVVPTSLGKRGYASDYDHLLLDPAATREWRQDCDRVDFVALACDGDFGRCASDVSDHAPIHATFSTTGPDDD